MKLITEYVKGNLNQYLDSSSFSDSYKQVLRELLDESDSHLSMAYPNDSDYLSLLNRVYTEPSFDFTNIKDIFDGFNSVFLLSSVDELIEDKSNNRSHLLEYLADYCYEEGLTDIHLDEIYGLSILTVLKSIDEKSESYSVVRQVSKLNEFGRSLYTLFAVKEFLLRVNEKSHRRYKETHDKLLTFFDVNKTRLIELVRSHPDLPLSKCIEYAWSDLLKIKLDLIDITNELVDLLDPKSGYMVFRRWVLENMSI